MQENRNSILVMGDNPEVHIVALDEAALDEVSGGVPGIIVCPIPPGAVVGAVIDGVVTGVKGAVNAALTLTKIF
jgi:hypothetical protein